MLHVDEDAERAIDLDALRCAAVASMSAGEARSLRSSAASRRRAASRIVLQRLVHGAETADLLLRADARRRSSTFAIWPAESEICSDTDASSCAELATSADVCAATETTRDSDSPV